MFLRVWGEQALFAIAGTNSSQTSYPVITPPAAEGLLKSIYWKPAIEYVIKDIFVCCDISYRTSMVNEIASKPNRNAANFDCEKDRSQNVKTFLERPDFVIGFDIRLSNETSSYERDLKDHGSLSRVLVKHREILRDRLIEKSPFRAPVLGTSECPAYYDLIQEHEVSGLVRKKSFYVGKLPLKANYKGGGITGYDWFDAGIVVDGHLPVQRLGSEVP